MRTVSREASSCAGMMVPFSIEDPAPVGRILVCLLFDEMRSLLALAWRTRAPPPSLIASPVISQVAADQANGRAQNRVWISSWKSARQISSGNERPLLEFAGQTQ